MLLNRAKRELNKIIKEIQEIKEDIKKMPPGVLSCARNGTRYKWFLCQGRQRKYLPKSERSFAQRLAYKRYLSLRLRRLQNEEKAIKSYLKIHNQLKGLNDQDLLEHPEFQKLLERYVVNSDEQLCNWMNASVRHNTSHPEHLIHETAAGNVVRSKSESMIETALLKHKIPFRYEELMQFGDEVKAPDFVTINPNTGEVILWEHAGKLDDPGYIENFLSKLRTYLSNKYIPYVNLILTCETEDYPLTTERIGDIIEIFYGG